MRRRLLALALAVLAYGGPAAAEPTLVLTREPPPRSLRMRPKKLAQAPVPGSARARTPMPAAPRVTATAEGPIDGVDGLRDVRQPVSFSLNLGYQVEGARNTARPSLGGDVPTAGRDWAELRSYGFGEAFLSTRGVGWSPLETYFALRFQAANQLTAVATPGDPTSEDITIPAPIATWFDRSGTEVRTGWAEIRDFLPARLGLANLRVRAGNQFIYGPWVLHFDGLHVAYEGKTLTASVYGGARHSDYTRAQDPNRPAVAGGALRIDLRGITNAVPIAVEGEFMGLTASDATGEGAVETSLLQVDWRPRRDIVVLGQLRGVNGDAASQRVELRTRYKTVTNFVFDVTRRTDADWRWDPSLVSARTEPLTEARRYLDLGPVIPRIIASARAGTLIRENIDLLGRVAIATTELRNLGNEETINTFATPYVELGGALEVRLRRTIAVGFSALSRQHNRQSRSPDQQIVDTPGEPGVMFPGQVLPPDHSELGEEGFLELGTTVKMSLGARRFSAMFEVYGRNTRYTVLYRDPEPAPLQRENEVRGGGRFTVDAWVGRRIRLAASYDLSSALDTAPQIVGYKSLRMTLTGTY